MSANTVLIYINVVHSLNDNLGYIECTAFVIFHSHGDCFDFAAGQRSDFQKHVTEIQLEKLGLILLNETMAPSDQVLKAKDPQVFKTP